MTEDESDHLLVAVAAGTIHRRQRRFPDAAGVQRAIPRWRKSGYDTFYHYGPMAEAVDGQRPLIAQTAPLTDPPLTCPLETAYGHRGPTTYCGQRVDPVTARAGGHDWCQRHLLEWGYLAAPRPTRWSADLLPGDLYLHGEVIVEILKTSEPTTDMFGQPMIRFWAIRLDTDQQGWVAFGRNGVVRQPFNR